MSADPWILIWEWAGERGIIYDPDIEWIDRASIYANNQSRRVNLKFYPNVNIADMVEAGHHPFTGSASVFLGDRLVISGPWRDVQYGDSSDPLEVSITESTEDDRALIPLEGELFRVPESMPISATAYDAVVAGISVIMRTPERPGGREAYMADYASFSPLARRILATNWTTAARRAVGAVYPMVFGAPSSGGGYPGTPAHIIDTTVAGPIPKKLLIAGHRVAASTCTIWGPSYGLIDVMTSQASRAVTHTQDALGRTIAYTEFDTTPAANDVADYNEGRYWISWTGGSAYPGGCGDVIHRLLSASTMRVDFAAVQALRGRLNDWTLGGYVDDIRSPMEVLQKGVLPALPVSMTLGRDGVFPVLWPWLDDDEQPAIHLTDGLGVHRASGVTYGDADPMTDIRYMYGWDADAEEYSLEVTSTSHASPYSRSAASTFGRGDRSSTIQTQWVHDTATAQSLAGAILRHRSVPRRQVRFVADAEKYGQGGVFEVYAGMICTITCSDLSMSAKPAAIIEIERDGPKMAITLELRDSPLRG